MVRTTPCVQHAIQYLTESTRRLRAAVPGLAQQFEGNCYFQVKIDNASVGEHSGGRLRHDDGREAERPPLLDANDTKAR